MWGSGVLRPVISNVDENLYLIEVSVNVENERWPGTPDPRTKPRHQKLVSWKQNSATESTSKLRAWRTLVGYQPVCPTGRPIMFNIYCEVWHGLWAERRHQEPEHQDLCDFYGVGSPD